MAIVNVTEKTFDETVNGTKGGIVLLDFWAAWCGPCRMFAPIFEAAAGRHPEVRFGKVDTESEPGLAAAFGVQAIPTLAVLRDGILLASFPGVMSGATLDDLVAKVQSLDMNEVRGSVDEASGEAGAGVEPAREVA